MATQEGTFVTKTTRTTTKVSGQTSNESTGSFSASASSRVVPFTATKTIVINRSRPSTCVDATDSVQVKRVSRSHASLPPNVSQGVQNVSGMLSGRQKEKRQMQELNERLANYIEKVRFLEAQNKKLGAELQQLRESWGKETEIVKQTYEVELQQLRRLLQEADQYKADSEVKIASLEEQLAELQLLLEEANRQHAADRESVEKLISQMAEYDGEISLLRRRAASYDEEKKRDQNEIKRLREDVKRIRADLDAETLQHINSENEAQALREQLEFLKSVHEAELKELSALVYRDTTKENREFWKNEMSSALREIQEEFESKLDIVRSEVETQYSIKLQEQRTSSSRDNMELANLREENRRIKSQVGDTRSKLPELEARNAQLEREIEELRRSFEEAQRDAEMEKSQLRADLEASSSMLEEYLRELQSIMDAKLSLELEIHAYRKLLDLEETRISQSSESVEQTSSMSQRIEQSSSSAMQQMTAITQQQSSLTAKTTNQRAAKGNITIQECAEDASFLMLEFTGKKGKEEIGGWKIAQNVDSGAKMFGYTLPEGIVMNNGDMKVVKIWAQGKRPADSDSKCNIESDLESWGVGSEVVTTLTNLEGTDRATLTQRTTYSQE